MMWGYPSVLQLGLLYNLSPMFHLADFGRKSNARFLFFRRSDGETFVRLARNAFGMVYKYELVHARCGRDMERS
jgi:hypothetical protein